MAGHQWLTSGILATQEAEIRRILAQNQIMRPYLRKKTPQKRADGMARGVGPEFKPQYGQKKKKK
jgi:hypothetical protein